MDHSDFFGDPFDRVFRSLPAILGAVYDGPERHRHRPLDPRPAPTIKGVDAQGRSYHALTPETYWWAHATFQFMAEQVVDRFDDRRLTTGEREQLYQEGLVWYRRYGVSDRAGAADTRADVPGAMGPLLREVLEMNEAVEFVLEMLGPALAPRLPRPLGRLNPLLRTRTHRDDSSRRRPASARSAACRRSCGSASTSRGAVPTRCSSTRSSWRCARPGASCPSRCAGSPAPRPDGSGLELEARVVGGPPQAEHRARRRSSPAWASRWTTSPRSPCSMPPPTMLRRRGLAGWSVDDVAEAAGVGRTSVYRWFGLRDDLVHAVLARELRATLLGGRRRHRRRRALRGQGCRGGARLPRRPRRLGGRPPAPARPAGHPAVADHRSGAPDRAGPHSPRAALCSPRVWPRSPRRRPSSPSRWPGSACRSSSPETR